MLNKPVANSHHGEFTMQGALIKPQVNRQDELLMAGFSYDV